MRELVSVESTKTDFVSSFPVWVGRFYVLDSSARSPPCLPRLCMQVAEAHVPHL